MKRIIVIPMIILLILLVVMSILLICRLFNKEKFNKEKFTSKNVGSSSSPKNLYVGAGRGDTTGPCVEVGFYGYANGDQKGTGILSRSWARAVLFNTDNSTTNPSDYIVHVTVESGYMFNGVKRAVVAKLNSLGLKQFNDGNIMICSIHAHSCVGGFGKATMYNLSVMGFDQQAFDAVVNGCVTAIQQANDTKRPAEVKTSRALVHKELGLGDKEIIAINRAVRAYLYNPQSLRDKYAYQSDFMQPKAAQGALNDNMTILRADGLDGTPIGAIVWYAVHPNNCRQTNTLVTPDNKGYAAYLMEKEVNGPNWIPGEEGFVCSFPNGAQGDVSCGTSAYLDDPSEIRYGRCSWKFEDGKYKGGEPCDARETDCNNDIMKCVGRSPASQIAVPQLECLSAVKLNGGLQYKAASRLYKIAKNSSPQEKVIGYAHQWKDMSKVCPPSFGQGFFDGTIDGRPIGFTLGKLNPMRAAVDALNVLSMPSEKQKLCQGVKGKTPLANLTHLVDPIVAFSVLRIGNFILLNVPGEFTTMSGRLMQENAKKVKGFEKFTVQINGLSNSYWGYTATPDEFKAQMYEGASTMYGPKQLPIAQAQMSMLLEALRDNKAVARGPLPHLNHPWNLFESLGIAKFITPVVLDTGPFGKIIQKPWKSGNAVHAQFWGSNPRTCLLSHTPNGIKQKVKFAYFWVEKQVGDDWQLVTTDGNWDTIFEWKRHGVSESLFDVTWMPNNFDDNNVYRFKVAGCHKPLLKAPVYWEGTSNDFMLSKLKTNPDKVLECPKGQFKDTGYCWSCPDGYDRTLGLPSDSNKACSKNIFKNCTKPYFWDIELNSCWKCPDGYDRTVGIYPVNSDKACTKGIFGPFSRATQQEAGFKPAIKHNPVYFS